MISYTDLFRQGVANQNAGDFARAAACYRQAVLLQPSFFEAYYNLGLVLQSMGSLVEAVECYLRAIKLKPGFAPSHNNLGNILRAQGHLTDATACFYRALEIDPNLAESHNNLGLVWLADKQYGKAEGAFRSAIVINPGFAEAYNNLATTMNEIDQLEEAEQACREALRLDPSFAKAYDTLGVVLRQMFRYEESESACRQSIVLAPDYAEAHFDLALVLLMKGDFHNGWLEYEYRQYIKDFSFLYQVYPHPCWDGRDSAGKTILIYTEQGFGDNIQFARYIPLLAERGMSVIVETRPELLRLLQSLDGIFKLYIVGESKVDVDYQCPLMSLPKIFDTGLNNIPQKIPYFHLPKNLEPAWNDRMGERKGLRVGLAWSSDPNNLAAHAHKTIPGELFGVLSEIRNVEYFSLQKGGILPPDIKELGCVDLMSQSVDFADTAALIMNLDLVITVDTAVAHLAGALGKPVWTLLWFGGDWRWMLEREDSPWYPTMRLFRQVFPGDWMDVLLEVREALEGVAEGHVLRASTSGYVDFQEFHKQENRRH